ncbi:putative ubiquitin [Monocercomonoides exilis]|uniref:putative ubiquitin n=1 Tax=Monocercomonoides exilis TaxID=2049356 RepID=UPI00355AAF28|nr:putative ubiquitin [Monocercomonoides exilis]|eukprot:MONOS_4639.1-p1 / transcript=MONOS_4639.1 / gene=MONOS_4639 / organism=Monocercomonoides_exilis_PA203 / gene_product=ubiquitin / transcript_product=ubiquitin / location=Mono_scaffold00125:79613-81959(-) / protein_length=760 / sequence_SO=supercontig / SO=protein_coding / is_pseudo=false
MFKLSFTKTFCTFCGEYISMKLDGDDWILGIKRGLADKYDLDARDLYFTQKQKIVPDDAKARDIFNYGEMVYLVKRKSLTKKASTTAETEEVLPKMEEIVSSELQRAKPFSVRVTICTDEAKGKVVVVENISPEMKIEVLAGRVFEHLHIPAGRMTMVTEMGAKIFGTWKSGHFELQESSEEKLVSKLTYCGQSGITCRIYNLISFPRQLSQVPAPITYSSATPLSNLNPSQLGSETTEQGTHGTFILQVNYEPGKKVYVEAEGEMLVEELKKKLEGVIGTAVEKMMLFWGETQMEDDKSISSFGFKDEDSIYALEKSNGMFPLPVKTLTGKVINLMAYKWMKVSELKERIAEKDETPVNLMRLIYNGKQLSDEYAISDYNIQEGSTISLVLRLRGGKSKELFVKSLRGQTLRFEVWNGETRVRDIKRMVAEKEGIPAEQQRLLWGGKELRDEVLLSEYGMEDKSTAHLLLNLRGGFNIRVMHLDGRTVNVEVDGAESVEDVKRKVTAVEGVDVSQMRLVSSGRWLKDSHVLEDFGIGPESTVHLLPISRGGMSGPGLAFVDVTKTDALVETSFSSTAPPWRMVGPGINIEGFCLNDGCPAFSRQVICRWGMKQYDLHANTAFCPCCLEKIVPLKPGFFSCKWRITAVKEDGTVMHMPWKEASYEKYTTYDEKEAGTAKFLLLLIEAKGQESIVKHPTLSYDVAVPEVCGICHRHQDSSSVQVYTCGHAFHRNCGSDWEETVGECPVCQMKMNNQQAPTA